MRIRTYDFRAFCRGELIRTDVSPWLENWLVRMGETAPWPHMGMAYPLMGYHLPVLQVEANHGTETPTNAE